MAKKMKTRKGNDGYSYPYTSPDLVIDKNGKSNTTKFNEIDSQIKDMENKISSVEINVLYPPYNLKPLICDNIIDNSLLLQNIINEVKKYTNEINLTFPNKGVYYFENNINIDDSNISININGNNSTWRLKEGTTTENIFYIKNVNIFSLQNVKNYSQNESQIQFIEVLNANKIELNNIVSDDIGSVLKIIFTYDINNQNYVKELITNNISATNVRHLMHICNIGKWNGNNISGVISTTKTGGNLLSVGFYMRPRCNNINLNNVTIKDCTGDCFHFNRADYTQNGYYPPFGTENYQDENIQINNLILENFGTLVGFNSEVKDITFNNITCKNNLESGRGIIHAYEGYCDSIKINNFNFTDINRIVYLEHVDDGSTVTHKDFGDIMLTNGTINGSFKKINHVYGKIKNLIYDNIIFNGIDGALNISSILGRFLKDINISFSNLTFNLNGNNTSITELFSFRNNGIVRLNNIFVKRNDSSYKINVITTNGLPSDYTLKIYANNILTYNLGGGDLYYGEENILNKTSCFKDDIIIS